MTKEKITTYFIAAVTGVALFSCLYILQANIIGSPEDTSSNQAMASADSQNAVTNVSKYGQPSRLLIPKIGVDAKVQHVGLTAKGAMGIPSNFTDVAWYKYGPVPGEKGSAVIDGHVDNGLGLNGVFKHLSDVEVGDDMYIVDSNGTKIHFKVTDISSYPYNDAPTEEIFGKTDKAIVRLITCEGHWVKEAKTYDTRLVVSAELVP